MEKVYIGKIVSTHGIKGELRILSDFEFKDKVFIVGNRLINDDKDYIIKSYRVHKKFDMVTLNDYKDINEVLFLLKKKVYCFKKDISLSDQEILDEDLISFEVISEDGKKGYIQEIFMASESNKILRVVFDKEVLIPFFSPMVQKIDKNQKQIYVKLLDGME